MMMLLDEIIPHFVALKQYCEHEQYKGWDPYDGLNSKIFKAIPFVGKSAICRLVWIQLFKRNPINLRRLLLVPKQHNAKGIGLFLQGYCACHHAVTKRPSLSDTLGTADQIKQHIRHTADLLLTLVTPGFSGAAWGYNFPWQCRREFLFPAGEPTVVATNFCAWALLDAYEITGDTRYRDTALSSAAFIANDLRRTPYGGGVIISYSKMPGNDTIFNASLLGSRLLTRCYTYTHNDDHLTLARQSVKACCEAQRPDGSWTYGVKPVTGWIDSFHTGYNLDGLIAYQQLSGDTSFDDNIKRGLRYYLDTFFLADGSPKYYNDRQYPIDIHCPGQLIMTLTRTGTYAANRDLVARVLGWTFTRMRSPRGYFYYQLKRGISSRIPYMRWSNAFMFCALATAIDAEVTDNV